MIFTLLDSEFFADSDSGIQVEGTDELQTKMVKYWLAFSTIYFYRSSDDSS